MAARVCQPLGFTLDLVLPQQKEGSFRQCPLLPWAPTPLDTQPGE